MRRHVWRRVEPRRRLILEVVPGLLLLLSGFGLVSAQSIQGSPFASPASQEAKAKAAAAAARARAEAARKAASKKKSQQAKKPTVKAAAVSKMNLGAPVINTVNSLIPRQMWFIATPTSDAAAKELAQDASVKLAEISRAGVQSLAVMEPATTSGGIVNFSTYTSGGYDPYLRTFYNELKARGITDAAMGMWVIMPEANMPEWGQADPGVITNCVTRTLQLQKAVFPASLGTVMFNSQTYPGNDTSYSHGQYKSLVPYVSGIPRGLIDSFGYQGFPWAPPANEGGPSSLNPAEFLRSDLAIEAARAAGVGAIWFNSGTFAKTQTTSAVTTVYQTTAQRSATLAGIRQEASAAKSAGFSVAINMFMEDKSRVAEGTDWSYAGADGQLFNSFAGQLSQSGVGLWRFF